MQRMTTLMQENAMQQKRKREGMQRREVQKRVEECFCFTQ